MNNKTAALLIGTGWLVLILAIVIAVNLVVPTSTPAPDCSEYWQQWKAWLDADGKGMEPPAPSECAP